jgi:FixJ family two-component response regulator
LASAITQFCFAWGIKVVNERLITVIDDDDAVCRAVSDLMRAMGYRTATFNSAKAFLESGSAKISDCIISDVQMPGLSGLDLRRILAQEECVTPMIMITAQLEEHLNKEAHLSGALCLLRKPFSSEDLIASVERALGSGSRRSG